MDSPSGRSLLWAAISKIFLRASDILKVQIKFIRRKGEKYYAENYYRNNIVGTPIILTLSVFIDVKYILFAGSHGDAYLLAKSKTNYILNMSLAIMAECITLLFYHDLKADGTLDLTKEFNFSSVTDVVSLIAISVPIILRILHGITAKRCKEEYQKQ